MRRRAFSDWRLAGEALVFIAAARICLTLAGFRRACGVLLRLGGRGGRPAPVERIAWAVAAAGRLVPGSTCLVRAIAGQALLRRRGLPAQAWLGVAKAPDGALRAHAWVESGGCVVVGRTPGIHFTPITRFE